jgi:7-cyano-7-deazaguanine synthase
MMKRAFVLLSGGIDSTTCLHRAIVDFAPDDFKELLGSALDANPLPEVVEEWRAAPGNSGVDWVEAISVDYGQRHHKEMEYAAATCAKFGIKHSVLRIKGILDGAGVMLADASVAIPNISYDEIKGVSPTYVPFRNGTLLSLITAHAQKWVNAEIARRTAEYRETARALDGDIVDLRDFTESATESMKDSAGIYFGAHAEDAANWAYPDCTPEFIGAMANAIHVGTYGAVRLYTPIQWSGKADIIRMGTELGVDWAGTWSCYAGGEHHCGTCPTCRARRAGFIAAGVPDPTQYQDAGEM